MPSATEMWRGIGDVMPKPRSVSMTLSRLTWRTRRTEMTFRLLAIAVRTVTQPLKRLS